MKISIPFFHKKNSSEARSKPGYVRYVNLVGNDPFADWPLIIFVNGVLVAILIVIGSYVYVDTQTTLNSDSVVPPDSSLVSFDQKKLEQVINAFDARAGERVLLSKGYSGPSDPSLP